MGKIVSIVNQKGGVGKTTTAVNMSACLAVKDKSVLLVDLDPQANAVSGVGIDKNSVDLSIYDVLVSGEDIEDVIIDTGIKNLSMIPSKGELSGAQIELVNVLNRESILGKKLNKIQKDYDYVVIDCPPSLGILTINALVASDSIVVPIQCEYYALEGVAQLMHTFNLIKDNINEDLELEGVLLTMFDSRINLAHQVEDDIRKFFKQKVYDTKIPRNVKVSEAPSFGLPVIFYDVKSKGAVSYMDFVEEVLQDEKKSVG
ncbi:MAG TPA: AAA family ATPase [Candidatus Mcinerneyibacterium sp.]|nr:AAA family ATPase [Candidatus Mcinerneyibacterium sp.]